MRPIPLPLRKQMEADPLMHRCVHDNRDCQDEYGRRPGRAEWEHCFIYSGRQVNEWWAIVGCCWYHHRGGGLVKAYNQYMALRRMSENDLEEAQKKYSRFDWTKERNRLIKKFTNRV